jgi:tetratricopeptide (TPR) repeat protein
VTARLLDVGVEAGILAVLLLSPLPFGSVLPWAQAGLEALIALTAGIWVVRMLVTGQATVRVNPALWPGVAMLGLIGAQLVLPGGSANRYATWESFRLFAAYLLFLAVLSAHLVTPGRILRLVSALVGWGVALAAWGLTNHALGRELVVWFEKESYRDRLVSTFVNANHQAFYFAILLFLAVGMLLRPSRRAQARGGSSRAAMSLPGTGPAARILFGGAAAVLGVALVLTASRGGVAAALAGVVALGALALAGRSQHRVLAGVAVGLGVVAGYLAWVGADRLLERLAVLAREPFADLRWEIWRATLRVAAEAPVLGVGLGAFEDAIIAYRPRGISDSLLLDYAHNDYLQLLAEGGVVAVLILAWAAAAWLTFVVGRWRDRQDTLVRGLVMGGLAAVVAAAFHSVVDFGLHMPGNAVLFVAVLAIVPAVVTLRAHRAGLQVDLREWRRDLGFRPRVAIGVAMALLLVSGGVVLAREGVADWQARRAHHLLRDARRGRSTPPIAELRTAEGALRAAARLAPWNPRIQADWAELAAELGRRAWVVGITPDGVVLRAATARDRLAASQEYFAEAYDAYGRSLRSRPRVSLTHERFGRFLASLEPVRRTVQAEGLRDLVVPSLAGSLGSDQSLLPRALGQLEEAVRLDPSSSGRRLALATFALAHRAEIPAARGIVTQEAREAIRLDRAALPAVARLLGAQGVEADLLWHAVPRDVATLVDLARILESQGRVSTAATALEDAIAIASTSTEKTLVHLVSARFLLRRGDGARALSQARQALAFGPGEPEVFAVLAEAYEANKLFAEAEAAIGSALAKAEGGPPEKVKAYRDRLASLLTRRGDTTGLLALRLQAVRATPNDAGAHLELAKTLETDQQVAAAIREYETARGLGLDDSGLQWTVAQAFLRRGLLREAAAAAEQAVRLDPTNDDLRVELGDLYSRIGLADRAVAQYRQVLERRPAHEAATRGLRAVGGHQNPG